WRTLETLPTKTVEEGDKTKTIAEKIVETTVAGRWVYVHRMTEISTTKSTDAPTKRPVKRIERVRLDTVTRSEMSSLSAWYYFWLPWLLVAVLMEAGAWQATLGKKLLGLKVTATDGDKPSLLQSLVGNTVKLVTVLSPVFLNLGFVALAAV